MKLRFDFTKTDNTIMSSNVIDIPTGGPLFEETALVIGGTDSYYDLAAKLREYPTFSHFYVNYSLAQAGNVAVPGKLVYGSSNTPVEKTCLNIELYGVPYANGYRFNAFGSEAYIETSVPSTTLCKAIALYNIVQANQTGYELKFWGGNNTLYQAGLYVKIW